MLFRLTAFCIPVREYWTAKNREESEITSRRVKNRKPKKTENLHGNPGSRERRKFISSELLVKKPRRGGVKKNGFEAEEFCEMQKGGGIWSRLKLFGMN